MASFASSAVIDPSPVAGMAKSMIVVVPPASAARLADSKLSSVTNSPSGTATWQCESTPPGITSSPVASSTSAPSTPIAGSSTPVIRPPATVTVAAPLQESVTTVPPRITRSGPAVVTSASDVRRAPAAEGARRGDGRANPFVVGARAEQQPEEHPGLVRVQRSGRDQATLHENGLGAAEPAVGVGQHLAVAGARGQHHRDAPGQLDDLVAQPTGYVPAAGARHDQPGRLRHRGQPPAVVVHRDRDQRRP